MFIPLLLILVILFPFLYLLSAAICKHIHVNRHFNSAKSGIEILLVANGGHTDIVMPIKNGINWSKFISLEDFSSTNTKYISIGWGEQDFYLKAGCWANLKATTALKALVGLNKTLIKVICYTQKPTIKNNASVCSIYLSVEEYQKLATYLQSQFKTDHAGLIQKMTHKGVDCCKGLDYNFYVAKGRYFLFKNCNCWVNIALQHTGVKTPIWTPFADGLSSPHIETPNNPILGCDLSFFSSSFFNKLRINHN